MNFVGLEHSFVDSWSEYCDDETTNEEFLRVLKVGEVFTDMVKLLKEKYYPDIIDPKTRQKVTRTFLGCDGHELCNRMDNKFSEYYEKNPYRGSYW